MSVLLPSPPHTAIEPVREIFHGVTISDPFRWLETQDSERTRSWIEMQTRYARAYLDSISQRPEVRKRVSELLGVEVIGPPYKVGNRYFFQKRSPEAAQPSICMREQNNGKDHVLIDPAMRWSSGQKSVHIVTVSPDGKLLAYGVRHGAEDYQSVEILDIDGLKVLKDTLPRGFLGGFSFAANGRSYYYVNDVIETSVPYRCAAYQHLIGTDRVEDREIFFAGEYPKVKLGLRFSDDRRYVAYILIRSNVTNTIDLYLQDLCKGSSARLIAEGMKDVFYPFFVKGELIVVTSLEAPNRKIIAIPINSTESNSWRTVIPESAQPIKDFTVRSNLIFVSYVDSLSIRTDIFDLVGRKIGTLPVPVKGTVSLIQNPVDSDELFYTFSSFTHPETVFAYETTTGKQELWSTRKVTFDRSSVLIKQICYRSKDGTSVPMSLISRKGLRQTKQTPTILTGYGGFGKSVTPQFSAFATFVVEQGCVFAIANVRGGMELGAAWHLAGKRQKRQNAIDDFISAAEWLIETGITVPEKLAIAGGSNGGLLVGAALTQRPELFRAVICLGPLLDMLNYHRFPLTKGWIDEYGLSDDEEDFQHLLNYSPYQRVREGVEYPAVLLISGDADTRCNPMHARKMTARLQAATASDRPILLDYKPLRGHMPGLPSGERIESLIDRLAFVCDQLGVFE
jgi:prolyl oligopeptidase